MTRACNHCDGLSRSRLLHRALAEAGRGLPDIEAGMPLPAGTGLSRRRFLVGSLGAAVAVYGGSRLGLGALEEGIAAAASGPPTAPILISIFLEGGADGLSVLSPQGDPLYTKLRPKLALAGGTPLAEDDRLYWHPALGGLQQLYAEKKVTVLPAVGYTHADQSHFTSRHYWEVGATDADLRTGWLGRYLDRVGKKDNPLQGLSLDDTLAPALATARVPVASISGPDQYDFYSRRVWGQVEQRMLETIGSMGTHQPADAGLRTAGSVEVQVDRLRRQLIPFQSSNGQPSYSSPVPYPQSDDPFPQRLAALAAMLAADLPLHCVALTAPGEYDTHADETTALAQGLQLTSDSLLAFQRDLEARGLANRVLVHIWSEFGRRAAENGDSGTDHGAAGVGFLLGTRVAGEMIGEFPGLQRGLDQDGNVSATSDFRSVYSALLEQWFGVDAAVVIPKAGSFIRPKLIA
ncbi:MAG TPA: DUF1501 domain-containing protein [Gaiellaceae bacterium]|nr:DUF1501 domain-containing protein [Gaiellaceae bacterium]